jgi:hypothetical protein
MNILQQLENAPKNIVLYLLGLVGGAVDDYTLLTLTIFCILLGFITGSILIPLATFFGGYFLVRLVGNLAEVIGFHARSTIDGQRFIAQSNMQVAGAIAQTQSSGTVVDGDTLP